MLRAFLLPLRLFFAVSLLALLMGGAQAQDVQPLPPLAAHVTDTVGLLSVDRREAIEARLVALEREKGAQVAVLLVATTQPEAIEAYALRVAEAGRLGRKGVDDGVLFVVARDDRRMRIEVGRGLEGAIPDAIAKLIIADECISALDVSIQAQVVNLMKDIQQETGTAYLFIAHDLSMVKYISDRIGVLHLGHLLETGTTEEIFENPIHPYTRSLLSAIPLPNPVVEKRRVAETYDYATSGIDYSKGTRHHVEGSHYVKCTDEEFAKWCK